MKIFIAKLSPKTNADDVRRLFERFGTVASCKVIMDHDTNRSKCYGFIEMPIDSEAYVAVVFRSEAALYHVTPIFTFSPTSAVGLPA